MPESFFIKKVAVLGAGVMGAQIAAQCVNAKIETLLFDLASKEGNPNGLVDKAIGHLSKLKPQALGAPQMGSLIKACNYEQDLAELSSCDLIIEAIAERLDWKEDLYNRIAPYMSKESILVSNTSGLSINALCNVLPKTLQSQFCGVHFFNPPRYMHLAELIPAKTTTSVLLDNLETWLTRYLGKGVIRAKDTPNFIANRIGVFSLLSTLHHAEAMGMGLDEVDAITGPLLGRPKSATCRTMDVVGLDTMQHVVHTMQEHLADDPWHQQFYLPTWLQSLIKNGHLGQKTGQGIYKKQGKTIEVYDIQTGTYRVASLHVSDALKTIMELKDPVQRMDRLFHSEDKQAQFLAASFKDLFHYCAYHLESIADTVRDVDLAMRWGFGWQQGPFETWQLADLHRVIERIQKDLSSANIPLPIWVQDLPAFYTEEGAYSPAKKGYQGHSKLRVYQRQYFPDTVLHERVHPQPIVYQNEGVCLWHLKDDVAVVQFKSKANSIGQPVIDGLMETLALAEKQFKGLIVYQKDASNFGSGADLRAVSKVMQENKMQVLEEMITQFQQVVMRFKYSAIPTIAAVRGRALGGGCELMMHCNTVVSAFEAYPGLVELGVGLIPAGGGCKEMALRAARASTGHADIMSYIQPYFEQIAMGRVGGSAIEAIMMDYFPQNATVLMHADEVLYAALLTINAMQETNYLPPVKERFKVAGIEGHARLQAGLVNWLEGGFISEHDYLLANQLAFVLCGGALNQGTMVDESWMLKLERDVFIQLASMPLSQARTRHLLETGKPLRN